MQEKVDLWTIQRYIYKYKLPVSNQKLEATTIGGKEYFNYLNLCHFLGFNLTKIFTTAVEIRYSNLNEGFHKFRIINKKKQKLVYMLEKGKVYQILKKIRVTDKYKEAKRVLKEALNDDSLQDYRQGAKY